MDDKVRPGSDPLRLPSGGLGGFLFLAASVAGASGAPWFDRLAVDPAWLFDTVAVRAPNSTPEAGFQARSSSHLALRSPLRAEWRTTEIVHTLRGGTADWDVWCGTALQERERDMSTDDLAVRSPGSGAGFFAGSAWRAGPMRLQTRFASGGGFRSSLGSVGADLGKVRLEAGASRSHRRADLSISVAEGILAPAWRDATDSVGAVLDFDLGPVRANASAWTRESASPSHDGIADTGSAAGWSATAIVATRWGDWRADYGIEHATLRTIGARGAKAYHDQTWNSARARLDLGWSIGPWAISLGARQMELEFPSGGLDRPFVHWNLVPDDQFAQLSSVLEDRSEHLDGAVSIRGWRGSLDRAFGGERLSLRAGAGFALTDFDITVSRTTVRVVGLFPRLSDDAPVDGRGWIAMATARSALRWKTGRVGELALGGAWRQPLAGAWRSRSDDPDRPHEGSGGGDRAVDPTGFHDWSLAWLVAL